MSRNLLQKRAVLDRYMDAINAKIERVQAELVRDRIFVEASVYESGFWLFWLKINGEWSFGFCEMNERVRFANASRAHQIAGYRMLDKLLGKIEEEVDRLIKECTELKDQLGG